jgi:tetratricopeptide (TPR) repeat protein
MARSCLVDDQERAIKGFYTSLASIVGFNRGKPAAVDWLALQVTMVPPARITGTGSDSPGRTRTFMSYSHKDTDSLAELQDHIGALEWRGLIEVQGDTQIAATRLDPHYALAYNNKGKALRGLRRSAEAMHAYDRAIQPDPE